VSEVRIVAEPRTEFGKGAARRVRRADKVPAVLYGHGEAPRHVSLPGHELMLALKKDSNQLLTLVTDDGDQLALPKAIVRDPIKGHLEHVDLIAVRKGERVSVEIPIVLVGDAAPEVLVEQQLTSLTVEADATALPETLELSVEGLRAGNSLKAGDVKLPAGTSLAQDPEQVVVAGLGVISEEQLEAELEAAEEELGAGQAGAGAAAEDAAEPAEGDAAAEGNAPAEA
jgi:large subunit ribosomal protein L25